MNDGEAFPNNTDIRHALTVAGTYTLNKFKFASGLNWHSGQPITNPVLNNEIIDGSINYESPNSSNLNDYLRVDCSATYEFNISDKTRATIGASVWNVTNKTNMINTYFTVDNEDVISQVENQSLGITPNISFRLQF